MKMSLRSDDRKIPSIHGVLKGHRGQPGQDPSHSGDDAVKNLKEVQSLNGKIAALNRFMSRATDKCLLFFRTLKKSFELIAECQQAFEELKAYLSSPPLLSPLQLGEELFLYLAVSPAVVSAALVRGEVRFAVPKKDTRLWRNLPLH